eukprot:maker-scaffold1_size3401120-snap-gene-11.40 protein:Tk04878 transcript:maker-scaffold1_size3401120-snap-gene-11.40-mRNA-1 annotation:"s- glutathione dehydrogenase"
MKCKAAVAWGAKQPLSIEEVEVEGPKEGEVLLKVHATGVCHTDAFTMSGEDPEGVFPSILGHEGGCEVVELGAGVKNLEVGDHVIPLYIAECGDCEYCNGTKSNLCQTIAPTIWTGYMPDGTRRFKSGGKDLYHYMGCSTFSEYTVVPEIALAKVNKAAPLDKVCLLGCGVTTGIGAVLNTAKVEPGATVAVFGLGGIGLSVIQGAVMAKAGRIIAIDMNPDKFEMAKALGATDFVNPKELSVSTTEAIVEMTNDDGVTTGIGAVLNTAKVEPGATVAVFGLGGIGLSVIQGAVMAKAGRIIAIDMNPDKFEMAKALGATDFVNPKELSVSTTEAIVEMTNGGVDYSFECIGNVHVMREALECCHMGWGVSTVIGVAGAGQEISTRPFQLVTGRRWQGTAFGGVKGRTELPGYVDRYMNGEINLDMMVTHTMPLEEINTAFDLMHSGESIRSVVIM